MKRSVSNIFFDFQAITYPLSFSYLKNCVLNNDDKQMIMFLTVLRSLFVGNFDCFNLLSDIVPESLLKSSGVK